MSTTIRNILLLGAILAVFLGYFAYELSTEKQLSPCSPGALPIRCYNAGPHACVSLWNNAEQVCREFILKFHLPPGRLTSPVMLKCQSAMLDARLTAVRLSTPECDDLHKELEEWKQRNGFTPP